MEMETVEKEVIIDDEQQILLNLQWEIDRKTSHIRSFENRLLATLSIDSVIVGIIATFYSLNPTIENYEKGLFIAFWVLFLVIIGFQLYLWWPKKASERDSKIDLEKRIDLKDMNGQLNTLDSSLYCRARLVYAGLIIFGIQILLLLFVIFFRIV